jgi:hypothetical protein
MANDNMIKFLDEAATFFERGIANSNEDRTVLAGAANAETCRTIIKWIANAKTWGIPEGARMCVNCGKTAPADHPRGEALCAAVNLENPEDVEDVFRPCTIDMTYSEAIEEIKRLRRELHQYIMDASPVIPA